MHLVVGPGQLVEDARLGALNGCALRADLRRVERALELEPHIQPDDHADRADQRGLVDQRLVLERDRHGRWRHHRHLGRCGGRRAIGWLFGRDLGGWRWFLDLFRRRQRIDDGLVRRGGLVVYRIGRLVDRTLVARIVRRGNPWIVRWRNTWIIGRRDARIGRAGVRGGRFSWPILSRVFCGRRWLHDRGTVRGRRLGQFLGDDRRADQRQRHQRGHDNHRQAERPATVNV